MYRIRIWGILYWLVGASMVFTTPLILLAEGQDVPEGWGCTTLLLDEYQQPIYCIGVNLATIGGYSVPDLLEGRNNGNSYLLPQYDNKEHDWQLVDIYYGRQNIPKGESFAFYFDRPSESLKEVPMEDPLTELAHKALAYAPKWLYDDLYTNFSNMYDSEQQDKFAQIILSTSPPYVDEVAFQVANISPGIIGGIDSDLLKVNAKLLYDNDNLLNYVNIVDYGGPPGDYYSTVEYCIEDNGNRVWIEAPKEIYYWYVVHPKCSDEFPRMDGYVYNEFWREFLFDYKHDDYLNRELFNVLSKTEIVWDRKKHSWEGGRSFDDNDLAVDVIGNWVSRHLPHQAYGERPNQPNCIIVHHYGNCGELQDLLCAGARTSLIPTISTMDICEDHVWCEMWDEGWHPYQVSWGSPPTEDPKPGPTDIDNYGICYDYDQGGGKEVSGIWDWRNDEYNYQVTDRYSDSCTLKVTVKDIDGNLVDGAFARIYTRSYYNEEKFITAWDTTDSTGVVNYVLGDDDPGVGPSEGRDYYLRVDSRELEGGYPDEFNGGGVVLVIDNAQPGAKYELVVQLVDGNPMPQLSVSEATPPDKPADQFKVEVNYSIPWEYKFGMNVYSNYYKFHHEPGNIEFFICDEDNYQKYLKETPFKAFMIRGDSSSDNISFMFPNNDKWYMVFSNYDQVHCSQISDINARLYIDQNTVDIKLSNFLAYVCRNGIEVYWETERNIKGLVGWNLYRQTRSPEKKPLPSDALNVDMTPSSVWYKLNSDIITGESPYTFIDTHVEEGETYLYKLEAVLDDDVMEFGPISCDNGEGTPTTYTLAQNYPNPFVDNTTICYDLPTNTHVMLNIYNIAGQFVGCLVDGFIEAGSHQVVWDGRDLNGHLLVDGVYIYRLDAEGFSSAKRMVLCR